MDEHSLQSPFVYAVYKQALKRNKKAEFSNQKIEKCRQAFISDQRKISLETKGASSSLRASKAKSVAAIAQHGVSGLPVSEILCQLITFNKCTTILELGTSLGINTQYMRNVDCVKHVVTIEANAELVKLAQAGFEQNKSLEITLTHAEIDQALDDLIDTGEKVDFVFVDANHTYEATKRYFSKILKLVSSPSIIVFDDINWSRGMVSAWEEIKEENKMFLSIENFNMGILFVDFDMNKSNYILNF